MRAEVTNLRSTNLENANFFFFSADKLHFSGVLCIPKPSYQILYNTSHEFKYITIFVLYQKWIYIHLNLPNIIHTCNNLKRNFVIKLKFPF